MDQGMIAVTLVGMAVVTSIPRIAPLLALRSRSLSPLMTRWLSYIPAAVLSALLTPSLLVREGELDMGPDNIFLWSAVPVFILAVKTRSMFGVVLLGMGLVAAARYFMGI